jgi:hypothetical protein
MFRFWFFLFFVFASIPVTPSAAADADTMIRLAGALADNARKRVSVGEIEAIGTVDVEAFNPYEKRSDTYTGVWMEDFAAHFGATDIKSLKTTAIDDYEITFDKAEWTELRILIATRVNGSYIDFDEKGPMRIVFPDYDEKLEAYQLNLPKWTWMITKVTLE